MTRKEKLTILAVAAALLLSGAALHGWALTSRGEKLATLQQERDTLRDQADRDALAAEVVALNRIVADHRNALPATGEIGDLLERLGSDLSELSVADRSLTMGSSSMTGDIEQIPLNVTFRGSFHGVFDLLNRLRDYERVIRVDRIAISRPGRDPDETLSVTARLLTFAQAEQEEH